MIIPHDTSRKDADKKQKGKNECKKPKDYSITDT